MSKVAQFDRVLRASRKDMRTAFERRSLPSATSTPESRERWRRAAIDGDANVAYPRGPATRTLIDRLCDRLRPRGDAR